MFAMMCVPPAASGSGALTFIARRIGAAAMMAARSEVREGLVLPALRAQLHYQPFYPVRGL